MLSIIQAAGWPIWPLILCSVVALALVLERFMRLRPLQVAPPTLLDEVIGVTRANLPPADVVNKLADNSVLGAVLAESFPSELAQAFDDAPKAMIDPVRTLLPLLEEQSRDHPELVSELRSGLGRAPRGRRGRPVS